ncbi:MAG: hypothetical protein PUC81_06340 [Prevotellaceae bacterium]|nr:hypothetical protein [Prevotellaceae bacterium]
MKTNEVTKHPKEIKAEISFEIIGEDEPTKYDKRRERWSTIAAWALLSLIASIIYAMVVGLEISSLLFCSISFVVFFFAWMKSTDIDPNEDDFDYPDGCY